MSPRRSQRGFLGTLILMPLMVALVMLPLVAARTAQIAEQKRLDEEVRLMLRKQLGKPAPAPRPIADDAALEAEVEANAIRF